MVLYSVDDANARVKVENIEDNVENKAVMAIETTQRRCFVL